MPFWLIAMNGFVMTLAMVATIATANVTSGEMNQWSNDWFGTHFKADRRH